MEFDNPTQHRIIFWKGNLDDPRMLLHFKQSETDFEPFDFHSAIVFSKDKSTMYACTTEGSYAVTKYVRCDGDSRWQFDQNLPRMENDDSEVMLQLKLDKHDQVLFGI